MKRLKKDVYLEWLFIGVLLASEWAGIQIAIFTPDISLPISLFLLWILVQAGVSFFLLSQGWHALLDKKKDAWRLLNIAVICVVLQGLGVFRSLQIFAGAAAITDSLILYFLYHWD